MSLYDGFSPTGSGVTNVQALALWAKKVATAIDLGAASGTLSLAKTLGVPLSSPLGRWIVKVSEAADAGGTPDNPSIYLKNAQIQIDSPFGRWAMRISQAL